jgi:TonB family protein
MTGSPRRSTLLSVLLHGAVIAALVFTASIKTPIAPEMRVTPLVGRDISRYVPMVPRDDRGGGGGGRDQTDASVGKLPRFTREFQFTPPTAVIHNPDPMLPIEPTLVGDVRLNVVQFQFPNYGDPNGKTSSTSDGRGDGGGIGNGHNGGVGDGSGSGANGGDKCCGLYNPRGGTRGGVSAPILQYKVEPEYTDQARKAHIQGSVLLEIEVGVDGRVHNIQVRQSLGLGLDERAIEAVKQWKFRPGQQDGRPVATIATVDVSFRLL